MKSGQARMFYTETMLEKFMNRSLSLNAKKCLSRLRVSQKSSYQGFESFPSFRGKADVSHFMALSNLLCSRTLLFIHGRN